MSLGRSAASRVTVNDSPVTSAASCVSTDAWHVSAVQPDGTTLTGDGVDGLEVVRGAALQQNGDRALSARPGKLEGLAGLGVDGNVGELDCVGSGREGGKNNGGVALHFE